MDEQSFLALSDTEIAARLRADRPPCWAVALGGTRRAYLAQGGVLATATDLDAYFVWVDAAQRQVLAQLYALGVETVIAVGRVAHDRGLIYQQASLQPLRALVDSPERRAFYNQHQLRVSVAGDLNGLSDALAAPDLAVRYGQLAKETASNTGPRLLYLFRGSWIDTAAEETHWGYRVGTRLGRSPTGAEVIQAYYGAQVPQLTIYIGSGRPRIAQLRPPFLTGAEDLYWSVASPIRLTRDDWCRLIFDHLWTRRTHSMRNYPADRQRELATTLAIQDGQIIGLGTRHALGFWMPETTKEETRAK
jgi:hypothetical protein